MNRFALIFGLAGVPINLYLAVSGGGSVTAALAVIVCGYIVGQAQVELQHERT